MIEARQDLVEPGVRRSSVNNADGVHVFEFDATLDGRRTAADRSRRASGFGSAPTIENPLMPGRYAIVCWVGVLRNDEEIGAAGHRSCSTSSSSASRRGSAIVSVPGRARGAASRPRPRRRGTHERGAGAARAAARSRGPSALGGGWRRFGELLYLISVTEFKKTYFGTVLGYVWSLLRPLLLFAVLLFVFTKIVRIGSDVPHYPVLLLMNVVLFGFFSEATTTAVMSVVTQEGVVRKTQFPRLVIPLSVVLTSLFNLGRQPDRRPDLHRRLRRLTRCGPGCSSR